VSAIDSDGRTIWFAYPHRDGKRFVVRSSRFRIPCVIRLVPDGTFLSSVWCLCKLHKEKIRSLRGLEPATSAVTGRRSNQLS
jgi:hypothetical protein